MLQDDKHSKVRAFARRVAFDILDSRFFRDLVREVVLRVTVEQEEIRRRTAVRSFLDCCENRGIQAKLREDGKIVFTNIAKLTSDMRAVLLVYRAEIVKELEYFRDLEHRAAKRAQDAQKNGAKR